ncbi:hypothetical protein ACP3TJ_11640 [Desulforudis sp. 1088]
MLPRSSSGSPCGVGVTISLLGCRRIWIAICGFSTGGDRIKAAVPGAVPRPKPSWFRILI